MRILRFLILFSKHAVFMQLGAVNISRSCGTRRGCSLHLELPLLTFFCMSDRSGVLQGKKL